MTAGEFRKADRGNHHGAAVDKYVQVTAREAHKVNGFQPVVDAVRIRQVPGRSRMRPFRLAGDKACDVPWIRQSLCRHHTAAAILKNTSRTVASRAPPACAVQPDCDSARRTNLQRCVGRIRRRRPHEWTVMPPDGATRSIRKEACGLGVVVRRPRPVGVMSETKLSEKCCPSPDAHHASGTALECAACRPCVARRRPGSGVTASANAALSHVLRAGGSANTAAAAGWIDPEYTPPTTTAARGLRGTSAERSRVRRGT